MAREAAAAHPRPRGRVAPLRGIKVGVFLTDGQSLVEVDRVDFELSDGVMVGTVTATNCKTDGLVVMSDKTVKEAGWKTVKADLSFDVEAWLGG